MTWFKVDDSFWSHPKTMALTADAVALWVRAGSWSCQHLTDGLIETRMLPLFGATDGTVEELISAGFWDEIPGGYEFHDWIEYQESSETVKERRRKARERMQAVRANRERTQHERAMEQNAKFEESSLNPDPTRPDPLSSSKKESSTRGTRLKSDWDLSEELRTRTREFAPHVDINSERDRFVDYYISQSGTRGVKSNWDATWRNWARRAEDDIKAKTRLTPTERAVTTLTLATDLDMGAIGA